MEPKSGIEEVKLTMARRQLGMALHLFMEDYDPISVHCLASGASEILDRLAKHTGSRRFANQILANHPSLKEKELASLRTKYWNAFKHFDARDGSPRDDEKLFSEFSDVINDHTLIIATIDYFHVANKSPISFQVFEVWYYALYTDKLDTSANIEEINNTFPDIINVSRVEQKRRLRRVTEKWSKDKKLLSHPQVDTAPLAFRNSRK